MDILLEMFRTVMFEVETSFETWILAVESTCFVLSALQYLLVI